MDLGHTAWERFIILIPAFMRICIISWPSGGSTVPYLAPRSVNSCWLRRVEGGCSQPPEWDAKRRLGARGILHFFFFQGEGGKKKQQKNLRSGATYDLRVAPACPFHPVTD